MHRPGFLMRSREACGFLGALFPVTKKSIELLAAKGTREILLQILGTPEG